MSGSYRESRIVLKEILQKRKNPDTLFCFNLPFCCYFSLAMWYYQVPLLAVGQPTIPCIRSFSLLISLTLVPLKS
jgi:hypothetical protein